MQTHAPEVGCHTVTKPLHITNPSWPQQEAQASQNTQLIAPKPHSRSLQQRTTSLAGNVLSGGPPGEPPPAPFGKNNTPKLDSPTPAQAPGRALWACRHNLLPTVQVRPCGRATQIFCVSSRPSDLDVSSSTLTKLGGWLGPKHVLEERGGGGLGRTPPSSYGPPRVLDPKQNLAQTLEREEGGSRGGGLLLRLSAALIHTCLGPPSASGVQSEKVQKCFSAKHTRIPLDGHGVRSGMQEAILSLRNRKAALVKDMLGIGCALLCGTGLVLLRTFI